MMVKMFEVFVSSDNQVGVKFSPEMIVYLEGSSSSEKGKMAMTEIIKSVMLAFQNKSGVSPDEITRRMAKATARVSNENPCS